MSDNVMRVRWTRAGGVFPRGQFVPRAVGDEDVLPRMQARRLIAVGRCEAVNVTLEDRDVYAVAEIQADADE